MLTRHLQHIVTRRPSAHRYRTVLARATSLISLTVALATAAHADPDKFRIITTTPDLAAIANEIGGDLVEVESVTRSHQDPHSIQAKPSFMRKLNRAQLLIYTGMELEVGWLPLLIQGARNPKIVSGAPGNLDASTAIEKILGKPGGPVDRSMGDVHPEGNPHYLLNPRNGLRVSAAIRTRLAAMQPEYAEVFEQNYDTFKKDMKTRIDGWEHRTSRFRGQSIITYHKQWEYLADWLGLRIVENVETKPGIPASPRHVASLTALMRDENIHLIVSAGFVDTKAAQRIADRTGAEYLVLPVSPANKDGQDRYSDLFDLITTQLAEVFERHSP